MFVFVNSGEQMLQIIKLHFVLLCCAMRLRWEKLNVFKLKLLQLLSGEVFKLRINKLKR